MTPHDFVRKWKPVTLTEMSAYQQHFLDLCELLGEKKPAEVDPTGDSFTFQKGVTKANSGKGWADVWKRGCFGWEYKGKHKDLKKAYEQLLQYREALFNPPLLIVCDLDRFEIHTNFPNTVKKVHTFDLDTLTDPLNLSLLKKAFTAPDELNPGRTRQQVTEEIADRFAELTNRLQKRKVPPHDAARFLIKLMFCMFAQDIGLLRNRLFTEVLSKAHNDPPSLSKKLRALFNSMAKGEPFGADDILWFNGGLFTDCEVVDLTREEIEKLIRCAVFDWSEVEPSIFGTLFERTLDPDKRAQIGAHYTGRKDIETILQTVLLDPLRREWYAARSRADELFTKLQAAIRQGAGSKNNPTARAARKAFDKCVQEFINRLTGVTVLDPACGSGNFLYLSLHALLDLEKEVWQYGADHDFTYMPQVAPDQLSGLEVNTYARELAQVVVWIGYLQWQKFNGFGAPSNPVLDAMDAIRRQDAVLDTTDTANPKAPEWPDAEFIVGNPPFLGGKMLRSNLGDAYVDALFRVWRDRVEPQADLCCYWFEKARAMIESGRVKRAGLLATQSIRGGANRETLNRIKQTGDIFFAVSDRDWVLDGANVHISMIGFDDGSEMTRLLDGKTVATINANLTAMADTTKAKRLTPHRELCFMADIKGGAFDVPEEVGLRMLDQPNPRAIPNSDVVVPWANGLDVTRRNRRVWIIDFGVERTEAQAAFYETPFEYTRTHIYPVRKSNKRDSRRIRWWLHAESHPAMRARLAPLERFLVTPNVTKHRLFVWMSAPTLPDHQLIAFARDDDYFFGVLHSRVHEVWARAQGTQVRERESGFRYTPTTCFETFPFPEPFAALQGEIGDAAKELDALRNRWLNPPDWTTTETLEFPGSMDGPWKRFIVEEDIGDGVGTVRYPRTVPKNAECASKLKARTLTNLYNERPAWLGIAHKKLDELVFSAYGWLPTLADEELLARLLELNLSRPVAGTPAEVEGDAEPVSETG